MALGPRRPARRGRPPLRQPHRGTGVLTPENGGDEPPSPRRVSLHPSGPARAGLRHQVNASAGRCDNTWRHNLIILLGSLDGCASNSNTSIVCTNGKWSMLMAIDSRRCSSLATPAALNQAGVPRQGLSQVQQPPYRLLQHHNTFDEGFGCELNADRPLLWLPGFPIENLRQPEVLGWLSGSHARARWRCVGTFARQSWSPRSGRRKPYR